MGSHALSAKLYKIGIILNNEYGRPRIARSARRDPLGELVLTILSQNTNDKNSYGAFESLKTVFPSWNDVRTAGVRALAGVIRHGGLANIKARRIKNVLSEIKRREGDLSLRSLSGMADSEAYGYLRSLKGVGPKTASIVMLFSFGKPFMPVDTHIFRVSKRLGLIDRAADIEDAHKVLTAITPKGKIMEFHLNLIEHGRRICVSQRPKCGSCAIRRLCDYYRHRTGRDG